MDTIWVVLENIHAYTMGNILEFSGKGGYFELQIKRRGGVCAYDWNSKGMG